MVIHRTRIPNIKLSVSFAEKVVVLLSLMDSYELLFFSMIANMFAKSYIAFLTVFFLMFFKEIWNVSGMLRNTFSSFA